MYNFLLKTPRLVGLLVVVILLAGIAALRSVPKQEDPTLLERYGYVLTLSPGASAERIESLITTPLEQVLATIPEIAETESISREGVSQIMVDLSDNLSRRDIEDAWSLVRERVSAASSALPKEANTPLVDRRYVGAATMIVALEWEGGGTPNLAILARRAKALEANLQQIDGTDRTEIFGLPKEELRVDLDPASLAASGLNVELVAKRIAASNPTAAAGQIFGDQQNFGIDVDGKIDTLDRLSSIRLKQDQTSELNLSDVATIRKTLEDPPSTMAFSNRDRAVLVAAFIAPNRRVDQWTTKAIAAVDEVSNASGGVKYNRVFTQYDYTRERLDGLGLNLLTSAFIVVAVCFLLMGWRSAIAVSLALPFTTLLVLVLFRLFDMPLHQMSLSGLIISLGLLIDNSIVTVDEYNQQRSDKTSRLEALNRTGRFLTIPLLASTATTAFAFLPLALMPGSTGEFIGMIGLSVIFAVVVSYVLAMTIIPVIAAYLDARGQLHPRRWWRDGLSFDLLSDGYRATIHAVLNFPPLGIALGATGALAGFALSAQIPLQLFPQTQRNLFQVELVLPAGTPTEETRATALEATDFILSDPRAEAVYWTVGEASPRVYYNAINNSQGDTGFASGWVRSTPGTNPRELVVELQAAARTAFPNAQFLIQPYAQGPPVDAPIERILIGKDLDALNAISNQLRQVLSEVEGITYSHASLQTGMPRYTLDVDELSTAMLGEDLSRLTQLLRSELNGVIAGSVQEGVESLPIRVRIDRTATPDIYAAMSLPISQTSGEVGPPLSAFATPKLAPAGAVITHLNAERVNKVQAFLHPYLNPAEANQAFDAQLKAANFQLPPGVKLVTKGDQASTRESLDGLAAIVLPLFLLIAGSIAIVFNSFRAALLILLTGALSLGYAFLSLWLFNLPLGLVAITGSMGLFGIAINGSIVVLNNLNRSAAAMADNIIAQREVVIASTRHIVATTLTTMCGFIPILMAGDPFWTPLAASIAGGVFGAAALALFTTPAIFRVMTMKPVARFVSAFQ